MGSSKPKSRLEQQIDENLRKVYQQDAEPEMPDRFMKLLEQLKEQDTPDGR
ncbi:NepR family anti-sigma factor [Rhodalgimonas zhirmunskyi]|uniref:Transcriptional regulator n=1 Tax=Rhodalgimonas zhirmunskyi TaxID=2964767 RepID=A0AAJ1X7W1_9RHOB|nr:NepR family anti-sigma factor [Rhodoalgimonas zhirmunskyi]MDQ2094972.1 transcriptional regulator [Rhodoalgimonas zhirmunskyi]